jgi:hypothetical protein
MLLKVIQKSHLKNYVELWDGSDSNWAHAPPEDVLHEVTTWIDNNELGQRTAYNGWQLRSSAALTAFILKWSPVL